MLRKYRYFLYVLSLIFTMGMQLAAIYAALCLHPAFSVIPFLSDHTRGAVMLRALALPAVMAAVCLLILPQEKIRLGTASLVLCCICSALPTAAGTVYGISHDITVRYILAALILTALPWAFVFELSDIIGGSVKNGRKASNASLLFTSGVIFALVLPAVIIGTVLTVKFRGVQMMLQMYMLPVLSVVCAIICRIALVLRTRFIAAAAVVCSLFSCAAGMIMPLNADAAVFIAGSSAAVCYITAVTAFIIKVTGSRPSGADK